MLGRWVGEAVFYQRGGVAAWRWVGVVTWRCGEWRRGGVAARVARHGSVAWRSDGELFAPRPPLRSPTLHSDPSACAADGAVVAVARVMRASAEASAKSERRLVARKSSSVAAVSADAAASAAAAVKKVARALVRGRLGQGSARALLAAEL